MTELRWLYPSQKQRIVDLYADGFGKSKPELANQFGVTMGEIDSILRIHGRTGAPGSRRRLVIASLRWQAEHGRAV